MDGIHTREGIWTSSHYVLLYDEVFYVTIVWQLLLDLYHNSIVKAFISSWPQNTTPFFLCCLVHVPGVALMRNLIRRHPVGVVSIIIFCEDRTQIDGRRGCVVIAILFYLR